MLQLFAHLVLLLLLLAALPSANGNGHCCLCNNCDDVPKNKEDALIALFDNDSTTIVACSVLAFEVFGTEDDDEHCRAIQEVHREACCMEDSDVIPLDPALLEEEEEGISSSNSRSLWQMTRELWSWGATSFNTPSWQSSTQTTPSYGSFVGSFGNSWGSYGTTNSPPAASNTFTSWAGSSSTTTAASTTNSGSSNRGSSTRGSVYSNTADGCTVCYDGRPPSAPTCVGTHADFRGSAASSQFYFPGGSCTALDNALKSRVSGNDAACSASRAQWRYKCGCENGYDPNSESCYTRQGVWSARGGY